MSYQIFARKFRPQAFDEVLGQDAVTTTLKNAIRQKRISQSFLFSGPRGIGKTSTARILAKALNCEQGPAETPCNKCVSCVEITRSNSLDVLEIDGASNRGIDEIRNLRETVKFKPSHGRYKMYIIDEVHMLTQEAFNALLKTLEEPPEHVKFIFATTEPHRVPLTILSRCQRFNFKRISTSGIVKKLEAIAKKEGIRSEKNVLFLIAQASEGALRDAESLLDQLVTFSEGEIKEKDVLAMLGLASEEIYFSCLTALREKKAQRILDLIRDAYEGGVDFVQFAKGLLELFRHLLIYQCAENPQGFLDLSESAGEELTKRKNDFTRSELLLAVSILQNLQSQLRRNIASPRLLVELTLLKLVNLDGFRSVGELAEIPQTPGSPPPARKPLPPLPQGQPHSQGEFHAPSGPPHKTSAPVESPSPPAGRSPASSKETAASSVKTDPAPGPAPEEIQALWPRVIDYVKGKRMSTGIFLSESFPVELNDEGVILGLPSEFQFHKETLEKDSCRRLVEEAFEVVWGKKIRIQFVIVKEAQEPPVETRSPSGESTDKLPDIVMEAMNIFEGAKIIRKD